MDAATGEVVAHALTDRHADDMAQVPDLLRQPEGDIASLTADGAYDGDPVYQAAAACQLGRPPDMVIPDHGDDPGQKLTHLGRAAVLMM